MATTSVDVNVSDKHATRNAPMGTTWIIQDVGADADKPLVAAKAVTIMDTLTASVTTPEILVISITIQKAVTGAANINAAGTTMYV